ncbi:hypothetical protein N657DRAFT_578482 [Parathielavia appendiculata]|uniref:Fork-head domain-containing protein n=1 Tax=Parathielavia appendiculata TaxID=2587402 RepID=A0AAN6TUQ7_9PEZI|nr:hypothetical protein N657DRAFT_578482 [Parathielavia appendiculata]
MTSSVLDGGAGCESPAPPAFSPLTDPTDPGNREPSVGVSINDTEPTADAPPIAPLGNAEPNGDFSADVKAIPPRNSHGQTTEPAIPASQQPAPMGDAMNLDAPMNTGIDYTTSPGLDLYPQHPSQILMALARLSAASQSQLLAQPPSTVRPSQVSLPPQAMLDTPDSLMHDAPDAAAAALPPEAPLESFARIEFADSVFQMTTYAVIIGRDQRALDQARRDERRLEEYQRRVRENEQLGLPAPSPPTQDRGKFSKSYVSEEGGMLGPESDGEENPRPSKRRKTSGGGGSASGDSHQVEAAAGELAGLEEKNTALNRQYVSHTPGAAAVNLSALRPSPYYVPFIGIHSPGPNIASRTKAISREHLKIEFNQKAGVFEAIPLHKNGFFCEDVHYKDEKVVLKSGDRLQIKDVDFVFIINGVPHGKTGAEDIIDEDGVSSRRYSEGGKEMSFDFESSHDPERRSTSPEEVPATATKEESDSELSEPAEDIPEPEPEEMPEQDVMETIEKDPEVPPTIKPESELSLEMLASLGPPLPKKRGPGRPPKNGIMSKREERLRKKAAMELVKKNMPQPPPGDPPVKRKVGRPRKHPLPEDAPDKPEKRKYKPRKSKTGEEGEGSDVEKTIKERRREKPKTPPLELNREDYTEEQLQKPQKNYGMLIDEVLSAAPDGLTLKQIYKRIQMKYPFYYFAVDTKGWESSVRHNLIGNDAFKKNDETHLWSRVPGIDIDAGKKRTKATSPDHPTSVHTFGQHYSASATPTTPQMFHTESGMQQGLRSGSAPQRAGQPPVQGQAAIGQHPQPQLGAQIVGAASQQAPRQPYPTPMQMQGAASTAVHGNAAAAHPPQGTAQATAYSSPYTSRPPPAAAAHSAGPSQGAARQGLPASTVASPVKGLPRVSASTAQTAAPASIGGRLAQPPSNGNTLTLKPAVAPELIKHVTNFKTTVTEQLSKRTSAAEAVAMSVINRGLGLAAESTIPEEESLEKIVLGVFESSRKKLGADQFLHPGLVQTLGNFKNNMIKTLEPKMGKLNAERLILSAVDRVLGFADRSTMAGSEPERKQYDEAENVLISAIQRVVTEHQRTLAAVASASSAPSPAPRPGSTSTPAAAPGSNAMSAKGPAPAHGPAVAGVYSTTAPLKSGAKPAQPAPAPMYPAPGPVHLPAAAPTAPVASPVTFATPIQQVSHPGTGLHIPASAASIAKIPPQAPVFSAAQGFVQAPGQYSNSTASPAAPTVAQARSSATTSGTVQAAQSPAHVPNQPQSPAHALAQAQAKAAAAQNGLTEKPAQVQAPAGLAAPPTTQTSGQYSSSTTAVLAAPQASGLAPAPATSQLNTQGVLPPKPHAASQGSAFTQGSAPAQGAAPDLSQRPGQSAPPSARLSATGTTAAAAPIPFPGQAQPVPTAPQESAQAVSLTTPAAPTPPQEMASPASTTPPTTQSSAPEPIQPTAPTSILPPVASQGLSNTQAPPSMASISLPAAVQSSNSSSGTCHSHPTVSVAPSCSTSTSQAPAAKPPTSAPAPVANMAMAGPVVPTPNPATAHASTSTPAKATVTVAAAAAAAR